MVPPEHRHPMGIPVCHRNIGGGGAGVFFGIRGGGQTGTYPKEVEPPPQPGGSFRVQGGSENRDKKEAGGGAAECLWAPCRGRGEGQAIGGSKKAAHWPFMKSHIIKEIDGGNSRAVKS